MQDERELGDREDERRQKASDQNEFGRGRALLIDV
jgi:hypothetical protein